MFRPVNITVNGGRLKDYMRSRLIDGRKGVRIGWGVVCGRSNAYQSACRIIMTADDYMWDSGWVEQKEQLLSCDTILPEGIPIKLEVALRDDLGNESSHVSEVFYNASVDWRAGWISYGHDTNRTLYFRREFEMTRPIRNAVLYVCGIGYHCVSLNGELIDSAVLDPAFTDYRMECQYVTYPEFEKRLQPGENCLGVMVGAGWRHNVFSDRIADRNGGEPFSAFSGPVQLTAMLKITYDDGNTEWILTDGNWQAGHGAHDESDLFDGETIRAADNAAGWDKVGYDGFANAELYASPGGIMRPMTLAPIIEHKARGAIACWNVTGDSYVIDFGQNIAGVLRVKLPEGLKAGQTVILTHAEELDEDGTLYTAPLRSAKARDIYIAAGDERDFEVWQPMFTYHGFRYACVTGLGDLFDVSLIEAVELHTDMETHSFFRCGDPRVTALHEACIATERANQHSILTDCPQRDERQGWMNDATVRFEETPYNFEIGRMFPKLIRDIMDAQGNDGGITCTAPFVYGNAPADPVCSSFLVAGLETWLHTGDAAVISEAYRAFEGWERCLLAHSEGYIVDYSYYGDWAGPEYACAEPEDPRSGMTPGIFMSTGYSYLNCKLLGRFAGILGNKEAVEYWNETSDKIKKAIMAKWYNAAEASMCTGSQACQVFSLWLGLIPEDDIPKAIRIVHDDLTGNDYRFTTGNLCTRYLMDMLTEYGCLDDAWKLITKQTYPSWGYMLEQEATTVWERFELKKQPGMNSHDHPMYAAVDYWCYAYLAGIRPLEPGYSRILIRPYMPEGLMSAQAVVDTVRGDVSVRWMKRFGGTHLHVDIPFGATAVIDFMGEKYEVGSGFHTFSVTDDKQWADSDKTLK